MNYGYPKIHPDYWISINQFLDIQKSVEYWISIILFLDIQKSVEYWISIILFLDIQKSNHGYPKIQFLQSTEEY